MSDGTGRVVVVGDALIDELRDDTGVRELVGGAGLNVAVGLQLLGVATTMIAMVGDDEAGAHIRAYLADFGVELLASPSPFGSARAVSTRSGGGEPVYVFNGAAQGRRIHFGDEQRSALAEAPLVVVSSFPFDDAEQTATLLDAVAGRLAVDPNPRPGLLRDRAGFVRGFEHAAARASLVKVGEEDAELLYGRPLEEVRDAIAGLGAAVVVATKGAAGASVAVDGAVIDRGISQLPGRIVDTMGAGDAVLAVLARALIGGVEDWGVALQLAMDTAAATCRFEGGLLRVPAALEVKDHTGS
ncbi:PfkB family carbohydrate kinase [Microbacterium rhizosphaerae]|uniref:PfkB family carbohydrate kinase n=1 Tax=Microbacterium rhizosphaerae TaxID=1678237 RepID=A0ABZ0SKF3_9MICO|nr:PfkB family carbohydrate kinase [Microbacterium rhizosphaerae]WPR89098.1 PfkB family carbohydrate kinase [Microbacterium rhizosphaerae]